MLEDEVRETGTPPKPVRLELPLPFSFPIHRRLERRHRLCRLVPTPIRVAAPPDLNRSPHVRHCERAYRGAERARRERHRTPTAVLEQATNGTTASDTIDHPSAER